MSPLGFKVRLDSTIHTWWRFTSDVTPLLVCIATGHFPHMLVTAKVGFTLEQETSRSAVRPAIHSASAPSSV